MDTIAENVKRIKQQMADAAIRAGRDPAEIQLCAATKMNDADAVRAAIAAGVDCCGENRVQELTQKHALGAYVGRPLHFIGHLQKNKARQVVGVADCIQSVDNLALLELIAQLAAARGIRQDILLEVNIASEQSKSGFSAAAAKDAAAAMTAYPALFLRGFMAIPPVSENSGDNLRYFEEMHALYVDMRAKKYDNTRIDCLSMGMSGDFADAIAAGSTMVRVGTAIFGARNYNN
ncbi:MAG: YggS family pyridoxal phosphate-dependent enzyme [Oscillospiraceae bacterium]|nr:YggS family pyridoxal phosphate-dependent enzyme [Oscillospiraceae bacterium]